MAINSPDRNPYFEPLPPLVKGGNISREGLEASYKFWQQGRAERLRSETGKTTPSINPTPLANRARF